MSVPFLNIKRRAELKSETQPQAENAALSDAEYVEKGGSICPSCGSTNICTTSSIEVDGGSAWQNCKCNGCDAEWNDVYSLKGYDNLERGAVGMIGSFMGTTLGFGPFLINLISPSGFVALLFFEGLWLVIFTFILLLVIIDTIKDNKRSRQC